MPKIHTVEIPEPKVARFLFADTRFAWFWLVVRIYIAWQWLMAGWEKITSPLWVGPTAGKALSGFLMGSLQKTHGMHPDVQMWYGQFLQHTALPNVVFFSHIVAFGELAVGIGLLLGIFTGIAAFFGAFMNMNYLFAGTISTNPLLFLLELFLILAWRTAGWYGIDRYLLPLLGTPWRAGKLFTKSTKKK